MTINVPRQYTYLDYAATAPLREEAAAAMRPYLEPGLANLQLGMNANSLHAPGRAAFEAMELARRSVARAVGASRPSDIVFTSGATEADDTALLGIARAAARERRGKGEGAAFRVIATELEHEAVLEPVHVLEREGFEVVLLKPDRRGFVASDVLASALTDETVLVSVQAANSEVGAIQPLSALAALAHGRGALFHTDATQALGKIPFDVGGLDVDAASFSAHKIGGPKGVGALYLKARTSCDPLLLGGGQEGGRRSTTQNVCGIAGFAAACVASVEDEPMESARLKGLRDRLYARLARIPGVRHTVSVEPGSAEYLPDIVHVLVDGYESETLVLRLDREGFGVSGGSACASRSLEPSHVLRALGLSADEAYSALRISLGRYTSEDDIERFAVALEQVL